MRHRQQGFTLIELLVAITMLSLLSLAGLYAMRAGFSTLDRTGRAMAFERRLTGTQRILEQMIANMLPARAICHGGQLDVVRRQPLAGAGAQINFFDGRPDQMRLVSAFSLEEAARGTPRILELAIIPGRQNEGVRLIVNEHLYWGPLSAGYFCGGASSALFASPFAPVQPMPTSYILADRLAKAQFLYRNPLPVAPFYEWRENWPMPAPPEAIRIVSVPLPGSDGRPVNVTVPVHLKRDWTGQTQYSDAFPFVEGGQP